MIGVYFSGTGNTRFAVEKFLEAVGGGESYAIEDKDIAQRMASESIIVFGFPIYFSSAPKIVRDFIAKNQASFKGKKVFLIATKGMHDAYGIICARKEIEKSGAKVVGSFEVNMPDNIRDLKIMQVFFKEKNDAKMIAKADKKIKNAATRFLNGKKCRGGRHLYNYIAGALIRIMWFYPKTDKYVSAPDVNVEKCTGCGICAQNCPKSNLTLENGRAAAGQQCTLCYRCFNNCPQRAITILGNKVYGQYNIQNHFD